MIASGLPPGTEAIWEGDVDTDWGIAGNWSTGEVPNDTTNVFIPIGTDNAPTISSPSTIRPNGQSCRSPSPATSAARPSASGTTSRYPPTIAIMVL